MAQAIIHVDGNEKNSDAYGLVSAFVHNRKAPPQPCVGPFFRDTVGTVIKKACTDFLTEIWTGNLKLSEPQVFICKMGIRISIVSKCCHN